MARSVGIDNSGRHSRHIRRSVVSGLTITPAAIAHGEQFELHRVAAIGQRPANFDSAGCHFEMRALPIMPISKYSVSLPGRADGPGGPSLYPAETPRCRCNQGPGRTNCT